MGFTNAMAISNRFPTSSFPAFYPRLEQLQKFLFSQDARKNRCKYTESHRIYLVTSLQCLDKKIDLSQAIIDTSKSNGTLLKELNWLYGDAIAMVIAGR